MLLTGGGTGGHITPILAVARELKQLKPECTTIYVGERGTKFAELTYQHPVIDEVRFISAGKFRRYHGISWIESIIDIKTIILNIRDVFRLIFGIVQAWQILGKIKPDVVFLKGGFVGVPIGLAAAVRRIPIITHDSDALEGLANRLVGRWAALHATALPPEHYNYPPEKIQTVGVLVEHSFQPVTPQRQIEYKQQLGIPGEASLLLITGGSSGAEQINKAIVQIIHQLLNAVPELRVIHQVGKGKTDVYDDYTHERLQVLEFLKPMFVYTGAADLVITRASANTIAELGIQGKASIVIPSPQLANGHQLINASRLKEQGAARIILEEAMYDLQHGLLPTIIELLANESARLILSKKLQAITTVDAAHKLAVLILQQVKQTHT